jgi:hypothetical protein
MGWQVHRREGLDRLRVSCLTNQLYVEPGMRPVEPQQRGDQLVRDFLLFVERDENGVDR